MKNIYKTVNSKLFLLFLVMFLSNLGYGQELNELEGQFKPLVITPKQEPIQLKEVVIKAPPAKPIFSYGFVNLAGATMTTGSSIMDMSTGDGSSGSSNSTLGGETNTGVSSFEQYLIEYFRAKRYQEENQLPSGVVAIPEIVVSQPVDQILKVGLDPCAEIKKQLEDANYKAMIADLKDPKKLDLNEETGFWQDKDGNYNPMEVFAGEPGVYVPFGSGGYQNINHVHTKQWIDANGVVNQVFPMPSPRDIATVYTDYHISRQIGTDPGNNYTGTINSLGYFQLRYTGQSDNLPFDQLKAKSDLIDTKQNEDKFIALSRVDKNKQIEALLIFMRDTLKITDIALYKVDDTGAKKLELDANNQIKETPCDK